MVSSSLSTPHASLPSSSSSSYLSSTPHSTNLSTPSRSLISPSHVICQLFQGADLFDYLPLRSLLKLTLTSTTISNVVRDFISRLHEFVFNEFKPIKYTLIFLFIYPFYFILFFYPFSLYSIWTILYFFDLLNLLISIF